MKSLLFSWFAQNSNNDLLNKIIKDLPTTEIKGASQFVISYLSPSFASLSPTCLAASSWAFYLKGNVKMRA